MAQNARILLAESKTETAIDFFKRYLEFLAIEKVQTEHGLFYGMFLMFYLWYLLEKLIPRFWVLPLCKFTPIGSCDCTGGIFRLDKDFDLTDVVRDVVLAEEFSLSGGCLWTPPHWTHVCFTGLDWWLELASCWDWYCDPICVSWFNAGWLRDWRWAVDKSTERDSEESWKPGMLIGGRQIMRIVSVGVVLKTSKASWKQIVQKLSTFFWLKWNAWEQ